MLLLLLCQLGGGPHYLLLLLLFRDCPPNELAHSHNKHKHMFQYHLTTTTTTTTTNTMSIPTVFVSPLFEEFIVDNNNTYKIFHKKSSVIIAPPSPGILSKKMDRR